MNEGTVEFFSLCFELIEIIIQFLKTKSHSSWNRKFCNKNEKVENASLSPQI